MSTETENQSSPALPNANQDLKRNLELMRMNFSPGHAE